MNLKLKDIIDLDYLMDQDEALSSKADIRLRKNKDKKIFEQIRKICKTDKALVLAWLEARRREGSVEKEEKGMRLLPGTVFYSIYSIMMWGLILLGSITGLSLSWSFLAYHGTRPVNVALFIVLFIVLQVVLVLVTIFFLILRHMGIRSGKGWFQNSIIHTLLFSLFFHILPELVKKTDVWIFKGGSDTLEYTSSLIRMKTREYREFFFWPFFILVAVFSFCFTTSTLGGTFFRIIVSDMAFGWQSTLMTNSERIHDLVTWMALPWSWFMPETLAHPTLAQVEGSRIILKDGISVLATRDLVSWWPFLCLGIFFYAVLPRGILMIIGILAQNHALGRFDFDRPVFRPLIIRIQSPVQDADTDPSFVKTGLPGGDSSPDIGLMVSPADHDLPGKPQNLVISAHKALVLAPRAIYSDAAGQKISHYIHTRLFFDVKEIIKISLDPEQDVDIFNRIKNSGADQVVLVHEAWQPPIRGLLYYFKQLKSVMPGKMLLWILLTGDAGSKNLFMDETDGNFEIWKKAVFRLEDTGIKLMRLI
ncbi:MAG: hypothetical protein A2277_08485 [Desulfobacterales bacterium RIFOXYA12_FULL_46_15]|nr:MAG: hypothetical protein A2277_08485 [Desulfobacterales bacterium RIFOXYA12_FULL_46_15]